MMELAGSFGTWLKYLCKIYPAEGEGDELRIQFSPASATLSVNKVLIIRPVGRVGPTKKKSLAGSREMT